MRRGRQLARGFHAAIIFLILLSLSAPSASAYNLLGGHWPYPNPLTYRNAISTSYAEYSAVENAIPTWDVNTQISFQSVSSGERLLFVTVNRNDVTWAGYTYLYDYGGSRNDAADPYGSCRIELNRYYTEGEGWPQLKRRALAAHEIGHALGLAHVGQTDRLMYPYMTFYDEHGIYSPTQDEINGVNYLYNYIVIVKTSGLSSSSYRTHVYVSSKD